jgi:hypothetical protein
MLANEGCPNTVNSETPVRKVYVDGKEDQTSSNIRDKVLNRRYPSLQS